MTYYTVNACGWVEWTSSRFQDWRYRHWHGSRRATEDEIREYLKHGVHKVPGHVPDWSNLPKRFRCDDCDRPACLCICE